ncbi:hypothetical protein J437_LFUL008739 [Ladona fulva]|uniref:Uncharacterized protein n=1 Tax=Ladona fulva TaxID=123851 RepID=A0A8K0K421_LADFU|nr:hypothetical protein J437_LFUL008739 [Ladona fulva]
MYGGVATPLALVHQLQQGSGSSSNGGAFPPGGGASGNGSIANGGDSSVRSRRGGNRDDGRGGPRLAPLRETDVGGNGGGENEPLLPQPSAPLRVLPKGGSTIGGSSGFSRHHSIEGGNNNNRGNGSGSAPIPGSKSSKNRQGNGSSVVQNSMMDTRYTPPWPRGDISNGGSNRMTVQSNVSRSVPISGINGTANLTPTIPPYLKPLPKPPGREHRHRHHNQNHGSGGSHSHHQRHHGSALPALPHERHRNHHHHHHHHHRDEYGGGAIRSIRRGLQRHHSDESLPGTASGMVPPFGGLFSPYAAVFSHAVASNYHHRIHSSADEISSLNHSPSISSSDESFSRTTDAADSPSPPLPSGSNGDTSASRWLYPSDVRVDPSSLENSPAASQDHLLLPLGTQLYPRIPGESSNSGSGIQSGRGSEVSRGGQQNHHLRPSPTNNTPHMPPPPPPLPSLPSPSAPSSSSSRGPSSVPAVPSRVASRGSASSGGAPRKGDSSRGDSSWRRHGNGVVVADGDKLAMFVDSSGSVVSSPLPPEGDSSCKGDSCGSFEYITGRPRLQVQNVQQSSQNRHHNHHNHHNHHHHSHHGHSNHHHHHHHHSHSDRRKSPSKSGGSLKKQSLERRERPSLEVMQLAATPTESTPEEEAADSDERGMKRRDGSSQTEKTSSDSKSGRSFPLTSATKSENSCGDTSNNNNNINNNEERLSETLSVVKEEPAVNTKSFSEEGAPKDGCDEAEEKGNAKVVTVASGAGLTRPTALSDTSGIPQDFEMEIRKLLEEQEVLRREERTVEELRNVNRMLGALGRTARTSPGVYSGGRESGGEGGGGRGRGEVGGRNIAKGDDFDDIGSDVAETLNTEMEEDDEDEEDLEKDEEEETVTKEVSGREESDTEKREEEEVMTFEMEEKRIAEEVARQNVFG